MEYTTFGQIYTKHCQFLRLWAILKATMVKFDVIVRTWDSLPTPNFVFKKSLKGIGPFGADL